MGGRTACVDDTLRNALMVEMGDLFTQDEVFQQRWSPRACAQ
jgi:hypothetical protein